jgi:DNA-directed RNA polymerase subunit RPC12/RpoP
LDQPINIPVGLNQTDEIVCDECNSRAFHPAFLLRKVSALISPTGKETVIPIQVFACDSCGHINEEFLPVEKS